MLSDFKNYIQLLRLDKPIGILLLMWPMLIALWVAAQGWPSLHNLIIFILGCILMRSAGCVVNDLADQKIDRWVSRTQYRPLVVGLIKPTHAIILSAILFFLAFLLVLQTNRLTIQWAVFAFLLSLIYPLVKRYSYYPQVVLGAAFACAIPMAFSAQIARVPYFSFYLYVAVLLWAVAYDTQYAMVDREHDIKIPIKSMAILFGRFDRAGIFLAHSLMFVLLYFFGRSAGLGQYYQTSLIIGFMFVLYQQYLIRERLPEACFQAFLNNQWIGLCLFLGTYIDLMSKI